KTRLKLFERMRYQRKPNTATLPKQLILPKQLERLPWQHQPVNSIQHHKPLLQPHRLQLRGWETTTNHSNTQEELLEHKKSPQRLVHRTSARRVPRGTRREDWRLPQ